MRYLELLQAVESQLIAHGSITADQVERSRTRVMKPEDMPRYLVYLGSDASIGDFGPANISVMDWDAQVIVEIVVAVNGSDDIDQELLLLRGYVHEALMIDPSQGTNYIVMTVPVGAEEPILSEEGETRIITYRTAWTFRVRTAIESMTG